LLGNVTLDFCEIHHLTFTFSLFHYCCSTQVKPKEETNMEICPICKRKFKRITASHASTHGKSVNELRSLAGQVIEEEGELLPVTMPEPNYGSLNEILTEDENDILDTEQKRWLLLRILGKKKSEAAELAGFDRTKLYTERWKRVQPVLDAILVRVLSDEVLAARAVTLASAQKAALVNADLLDSYDEKTQLAAAHDILDRSGISRRPGPKVDVQAETLHLYYSQLSLEELDEEISKALAEERERAIEGEFQVVDEDEPFTGKSWRNRAFNWYWYTLRPEQQLNSFEEMQIMNAFHLEDAYGKAITREEAETVLEEFGIDWRKVPEEQ